MTTSRRSAIISFCAAIAFVESGCGRDGLLSNTSLEGDTPSGVRVRRVFHLPNLTAQWAAYQDGAGPWIPIQPIEKGGEEYEFVLTDPSQQLGFAVAADVGLLKGEVFVTFLTVEDCLRGVEVGMSGPSGSARPQRGTISSSVTGLADGEHATVSLAGRFWEAKPEWGSKYGTTDDWPLSGDLLVTAGPLNGLPTRMIVRRNLPITLDMTIPPIDFSNGEAVPLQAGQVILTPPPGADQTYGDVVLTINTGGSIVTSQGGAVDTTIPFSFLPSAQQTAGDLYKATYTYSSAAGSAGVTSFFHSPTGHQLVVPALPSGARVWNSGGSGDVRLTAAWPVPEPGAALFADYSQGPDVMDSRWWSLTVSPSYASRGGGAVTVPDLRNVAGWNSLWALAVGAPTDWRVGSIISSNAGSAPRDGSSEVWTAQHGTLTP